MIHQGVPYQTQERHTQLPEETAQRFTKPPGSYTVRHENSPLPTIGQRSRGRIHYKPSRQQPIRLQQMVRQEEHHPEIYERALILAKWQGRKDESDASREATM